jgi:hypothetical protein
MDVAYPLCFAPLDFSDGAERMWCEREERGREREKRKKKKVGRGEGEKERGRERERERRRRRLIITFNPIITLNPDPKTPVVLEQDGGT